MSLSVSVNLDLSKSQQFQAKEIVQSGELDALLTRLLGEYLGGTREDISGAENRSAVNTVQENPNTATSAEVAEMNDTMSQILAMLKSGQIPMQTPSNNPNSSFIEPTLEPKPIIETKIEHVNLSANLDISTIINSSPTEDTPPTKTKTKKELTPEEKKARKLKKKKKKEAEAAAADFFDGFDFSD